MRYAMIARHRDEFPVRLMCRVLDVSVSGFYAYLRRPLFWRRVSDEVLMAHVRIAFAASGDMSVRWLGLLPRRLAPG